MADVELVILAPSGWFYLFLLLYYAVLAAVTCGAIYQFVKGARSWRRPGGHTTANLVRIVVPMVLATVLSAALIIENWGTWMVRREMANIQDISVVAPAGFTDVVVSARGGCPHASVRLTEGHLSRRLIRAKSDESLSLLEVIAADAERLEADGWNVERYEERTDGFRSDIERLQSEPRGWSFVATKGSRQLVFADLSYRLWGDCDWTYDPEATSWTRIDRYPEVDGLLGPDWREDLTWEEQQQLLTTLIYPSTMDRQPATLSRVGYGLAREAVRYCPVFELRDAHTIIVHPHSALSSLATTLDAEGWSVIRRQSRLTSDFFLTRIVEAERRGEFIYATSTADSLWAQRLPARCGGALQTDDEIEIVDRFG